MIVGDYGTGKTALLKNIIRTFKGKRKVIFYSYNRREKTLDLNKLLYGKSIYNKFFHIKPKKMILLLDEVKGLNMKERADLIYYYNKKYIKSIVLVGKNKREINLNSELESILGDNILKLENLSSENAVKLIKKRMNNSKFMSDKMIRMIHAKNQNTRTFLENCEDVCRHANDVGCKRVELNHVKILNR